MSSGEADNLLVETLEMFSELDHVVKMDEARALFETANRIAAVAESDDELQTAAGLMQQAAELGFSRAFGAYGNMLASGRGVKKDVLKAFQFWTDSALDFGDAESAFKIGMVYRDGVHYSEDPAAALAWFMLARDLGLDLANLDVDEVAYNVSEIERAAAFERYDRLKANCVTLR